MNPYLMVAAGLLKGYSSGKQRKEQLEMQKAKIPLIKLQMEQQKLFNTVVENYLKQQGYSQTGMPSTGAQAVPEIPAAPQAPEPDDYKPTYQSTKNIMRELGQVGSQFETVPPTAQPVQPMGGPAQPQPMGGQDLLAPALIQSMSGGRLPLYDVEIQQQRRRQFQQTEGRLSRQFERTYRQREGALSAQPVTIDGVPHIQPMDRYQRPVGEPYQIGGKKGLPAETVGKFQQAKDALTDVQKLETELTNPDGSFNRVKLFQMATKMPWTSGRNLAPIVKNALDAKLRLTSGAAFGAKELQSVADQMAPSVLDNDEGIRAKLDNIKRFMQGTVELFDPNRTYSKDVMVFTAEDGNKYALEPGEPTDTPIIPETEAPIKTADDFLKKYNL